jgi:lysophospholipase L1-like esterase
MRSVLLLGDSHTHGSYGKSLEKLFKDAGWSVNRVGWVGANATHYLKGKETTLGMGGTGSWSAAKAQNYDLAIMSLGTNDAAGIAPGASAASTAQKLKELSNDISASKIVYVGPPSFSENAARTYNPAFAKESLILKADRLWDATFPLFTLSLDPRQATAPFVTEKDIHFGPKGGKAWAQFVFDSLAVKTTSNTGVPPPSTVSKTTKVIGLGVLAVVVFFVVRHYTKNKLLATAVALPGIPPL